MPILRVRLYVLPIMFRLHKCGTSGLVKNAVLRRASNSISWNGSGHVPLHCTGGWLGRHDPHSNIWYGKHLFTVSCPSQKPGGIKQGGRVLCVIKWHGVHDISSVSRHSGLGIPPVTERLVLINAEIMLSLEKKQDWAFHQSQNSAF